MKALGFSLVMAKHEKAKQNNLLDKHYFLALGMTAGGILFAMSGALISHLVVEQSFTDAVPSIVLLLMTVLSWYYRPDTRKVTFRAK